MRSRPRRCSARRSWPRSPTWTRATSPRTSPAAPSSATCCCGWSLAANLMAMLIQYLSAKVGIATGRNLPELCREHFPRRVSVGLWIQAELIAMATDLAEFVGAAIAPQPALRRPAVRRRADHRRRSPSRSSGSRRAATAASRPRSRGSLGVDPARLPVRGASTPTPDAGGDRRRLRARLRRHREHPAGHRDPRRDRDAARDLPALGAHPEPHPAPQRRRAPRAAALRAPGRGHRDGHRRRS